MASNQGVGSSNLSGRTSQGNSRNKVTLRAATTAPCPSASRTAQAYLTTHPVKNIDFRNSFLLPLRYPSPSGRDAPDIDQERQALALYQEHRAHETGERETGSLRPADYCQQQGGHANENMQDGESGTKLTFVNALFDFALPEKTNPEHGGPEGPPHRRLTPAASWCYFLAAFTAK